MRANGVNNRGIKYFKGVHIFQTFLFREVQIFRYIWTGGNQKSDVSSVSSGIPRAGDGACSTTVSLLY